MMYVAFGSLAFLLRETHADAGLRGPLKEKEATALMVPHFKKFEIPEMNIEPKIIEPKIDIISKPFEPVNKFDGLGPKFDRNLDLDRKIDPNRTIDDPQDLKIDPDRKIDDLQDPNIDDLGMEFDEDLAPQMDLSLTREMEKRRKQEELREAKQKKIEKDKEAPQAPLVPLKKADKRELRREFKRKIRHPDRESLNPKVHELSAAEAEDLRFQFLKLREKRGKLTPEQGRELRKMNLQKLEQKLELLKAEERKAEERKEKEKERQRQSDRYVAGAAGGMGVTSVISGGVVIANLDSDKKDSDRDDDGKKDS